MEWRLMNSKIESITIGIGVKDVKDATEWYKNLLGNIIETMEPSPGTVELKLTENVWLQLDDTGYLKLGGESSIIRLETNDVKSTHTSVKKLASCVGDIVLVEDMITYFDFKDPWGNRLSYYQLL
jgi:predicted enzyme related to lactoylglutathione lyase